MRYLSGNTKTGLALQFIKDLIDDEGRGNARQVRHHDLKFRIQSET